MKLDYILMVDRIIDNALEEDIGHGDITTSAVVESSLKGKARLVSRSRFLLAGIEIFGTVFARLDPDVIFQRMKHDGDMVTDGEVMAFIEGSVRSILTAERTALNFVQRLSGIATLTRRYVEEVGSSGARVIDTRKTTPGLRILEKYAVRVGGGFNHRFGLFDGILIKDNHIVAAGSIAEAVKRVKAGVPHTLKIEVEVEGLDGLESAINAGADAVLLDNMSLEDMRKAVSMARGRVLLEASGGITLDSIEEVARTGVDMVSIGALTHSAVSVDVSLELY